MPATQRWHPLVGLLAVTYVPIICFGIDGVWPLVAATERRWGLSGRRQWLAIGGGRDLVIAARSIGGLPGAFAWAPGLWSASTSGSPGSRSSPCGRASAERPRPLPAGAAGVLG